jgi:RES domain-containing protein
MATAWRIVSPRYSSEILSGIGAARFPGRWNRTGDQLIYSAGTQSLALLERLVYMISPYPGMTMGAITVPNRCVEYLDADEFEARALVANRKISQELGSEWITSKRSAVLAVPSVHIHPSCWKEEPNILINPLHPDFRKARLRKHFAFSYDKRLEK